MLDPYPFHPLFHISPYLPLIAGRKLPLQRHSFAQKAQHITAGKLIQGMTDQSGINLLQPRPASVRRRIGYLKHCIGTAVLRVTAAPSLPSVRRRRGLGRTTPCRRESPAESLALGVAGQRRDVRFHRGGSRGLHAHCLAKLGRHEPVTSEAQSIQRFSCGRRRNREHEN